MLFEGSIFSLDYVQLLKIREKNSKYPLHSQVLYAHTIVLQQPVKVSEKKFFKSFFIRTVVAAPHDVGSSVVAKN